MIMSLQHPDGKRKNGATVSAFLVFLCQLFRKAEVIMELSASTNLIPASASRPEVHYRVVKIGR